MNVFLPRMDLLFNKFSICFVCMASKSGLYRQDWWTLIHRYNEFTVQLNAGSILGLKGLLTVFTDTTIV